MAETGGKEVVSTSPDEADAESPKEDDVSCDMHWRSCRMSFTRQDIIPALGAAASATAQQARARRVFLARKRSSFDSSGVHGLDSEAEPHIGSRHFVTPSEAGEVTT